MGLGLMHMGIYMRRLICRYHHKQTNAQTQPQCPTHNQRAYYTTTNLSGSNVSKHCLFVPKSTERRNGWLHSLLLHEFFLM